MTAIGAAAFDDSRFVAIPKELRAKNNFVCWRYEEHDGKQTKVPYNVRTGQRAKSNDCSTWSTFFEALDAASDPANKYDGIGFEIEEPYIGFDFDGVVHLGKVDPYVLEVLKLLGNPYAEITPSGKGIRAIVMGLLPEGEEWRRKRLDQDRDGEKYGVEIYNGKQYLTLTGNRLPTSGDSVPAADVRVAYQVCMSPKFRALWLGDTWGYDGDDSRADLALCAILKDIFGNDAAKIEEWFGKSQLGQRDKWKNRKDYRERTIAKVLGGEPKHAKAQATDVTTHLTCTPASEIPVEMLKWLWPDRIPLGMVTLFCGDPDVGKSLTVADVVSRITTGRDWPDSENDHTPMTVAMLCAEDEWDDTIGPRLIAAGADLQKVLRVNPIEIEFKGKKSERALALDRDIDALEEMLRAHPEIQLCVFDPLASYLGSSSRNLEKEIRPVLDAVKNLAKRTGVTILIADHFNKNLVASAIHRVSGSTSVVGAPRAAWGFVKDPDNPEERMMVRIKCNVTKKRTGLRYAFGERTVKTSNGQSMLVPHVVWKGHTETTADEVFARNADPEDAKLTKAVKWLQTFLANGPKPAREVYQAGEAQGYHDQFLKRQVRAKSGPSFTKKTACGCGSWTHHRMMMGLGRCFAAHTAQIRESEVSGVFGSYF